MTENKKTVEKYMDAYNRLDHAGILSCLTDDVEWILPGIFHTRGKKEYDGQIEHESFIGPPVIKTLRMVEENDVVVAEGTVDARMKAGGSMRILFCDVFVMKDGKIKQLTSYLVQESAPGGGTDAAA